MMERYFIDRSIKLEKGEELGDIFPESGYQVGLTPEFIERARDHSGHIESLKKEDRPETPQPPPKDKKCRFFYPLNVSTVDSKVNIKRFIPKDFPEFQTVMDGWSKNMMSCIDSVAQMSAIGLGLEKDTFTNMLSQGPHLLAPTGSNLLKFKQGDVFAGFHYDFNFLTIHGKSRYPALYIWLRTGERVPVKMPDGYLLLQSGRQFEMLTGGHIPRGMHEVIYSRKTREKVEKEMAEKEHIFRVSSTLFGHVRDDVNLLPLAKFREDGKEYEDIDALRLKEIELTAIELLSE